jgi:hypothetical protein
MPGLGIFQGRLFKGATVNHSLYENCHFQDHLLISCTERRAFSYNCFNPGRSRVIFDTVARCKMYVCKPLVK